MKNEIDQTRLRSVLCLVLALQLAAPAAHAAIVTLTDLNSTVVFDTGSQAGMSDWLVEGGDILQQQWFWYRVGSSGPEYSLDTLAQTGIRTNDSNFNPGFDSLALQYTQSGATSFVIELHFTLTGGTPASGVSDIAETILLKNTSSSSLDFHFFQYTDFDLKSSDTIEFPFPNTARQVGANAAVAETVATPMAQHHEANFAPNIFNSLTNGTVTMLNDANGPFTGNVNWGFQWDLNLAPGSSFIISEDKNVLLPEPNSIALIALVLALTKFRPRCGRG